VCYSCILLHSVNPSSARSPLSRPSGPAAYDGRLRYACKHVHLISLSAHTFDNPGGFLLQHRDIHPISKLAACTETHSTMPYFLYTYRQRPSSVSCSILGTDAVPERIISNLLHQPLLVQLNILHCAISHPSELHSKNPHQRLYNITRQKPY
jgi:hypothetical protein